MIILYISLSEIAQTPYSFTFFNGRDHIWRLNLSCGSSKWANLSANITTALFSWVCLPTFGQSMLLLDWLCFVRWQARWNFLRESSLCQAMVITNVCIMWLRGEEGVMIYILTAILWRRNGYLLHASREKSVAIVCIHIWRICLLLCIDHVSFSTLQNIIIYQLT